MITFKHVAYLRSLGLKSMVFLNLFDFLSRHYGEKITLGDIALYCKVSKAGATQLIDRLEQTGQGGRNYCHNDRRVVLVTLTKVGKKGWKECE